MRLKPGVGVRQPSIDIVGQGDNSPGTHSRFWLQSGAIFIGQLQFFNLF